MSMWDSIFGQATQGVSGQGMANQQAPYTQMNQAAQQLSLSNSLAQQQAYNNALSTGMGMYQQQQLPQWVYDNCVCTLEEFAKKIFPDDEQAQFMFILRNTGV